MIPPDDFIQSIDWLNNDRDNFKLWLDKFLDLYKMAEDCPDLVDIKDCSVKLFILQNIYARHMSLLTDQQVEIMDVVNIQWNPSYYETCVEYKPDLCVLTDLLFILNGIYLMLVCKDTWTSAVIDYLKLKYLICLMKHYYYSLSLHKSIFLYTCKHTVICSFFERDSWVMFFYYLKYHMICNKIKSMIVREAEPAKKWFKNYDHDLFEHRLVCTWLMVQHANFIDVTMPDIYKHQFDCIRVSFQ